MRGRWAVAACAPALMVALLLALLWLAGCRASSPQPSQLYGCWVVQGEDRLSALEFLPGGALTAHYPGFTCAGCWELRKEGLYTRYTLDARVCESTQAYRVRGEELQLGELRLVRRGLQAVDYP